MTMGDANNGPNFTEEQEYKAMTEAGKEQQEHYAKLIAPTGLELLRLPFDARHISRLPKPTKAQTEAVRADYKKGIRCKECGAWHHPDVVHLDYVGHAALTHRLLDADIAWHWEPLSMTAEGLPVMDPYGGMWIRLTVCGVTRLGYGHAGEKSGGDAIKEVIGDALRNAAMRFGAALDLWHKGDLHIESGHQQEEEAPAKPSVAVSATAEAWSRTQPETQNRLRKIAAHVIEQESPSKMIDVIDSESLDQDEKAALWYLLDSKTRSAIKAAQAQMKA
jgi:hypothetical protein